MSDDGEPEVAGVHVGDTLEVVDIAKRGGRSWLVLTAENGTEWHTELPDDDQEIPAWPLTPQQRIKWLRDGIERRQALLTELEKDHL